MSINIEWLGHCAFRLTRSDGLRILIDPFDDSVGYRVPDYSCDILVISHYHYDTSAVHLVPEGFQLVDNVGTTLIDDIAFNAFPYPHDGQNGRDYGQVNIIQFEMDGFKIGYLSHIGEYPKSWVIEKLGKLDICFIPVGGLFTIGPNDAKFLVRELNPGFVIPMHFKTHYLNFTLLPLNEFLKMMTNTVHQGDWRVTLDENDLTPQPTVLVLQHWPGIDPV